MLFIILIASLMNAITTYLDKYLVNLGHLTVHFSGDPAQCLPGAIVVENKPAPDVQIGTEIEINE